jgi:hypothetical protein
MTNLDNTITLNNNPKTDYRQVGAVLNEFLTHKKLKPINLTEINPEVIENKKTFSGAAAATGAGLIETRVATPITFLSQRGGVFIESGINFKDNAAFNVTFNGVRTDGSFTLVACGTATTNEISTFSNGTATLLRETAFIEGCEDVLARTPDANSTIAVFEELLENEKLILADNKVAASITSNAGVAAINPTGLSTIGEITDGMLAMIGNLGGFYTNTGNGLAFYLNRQGFSRMLREQTNTGAFISGRPFGQGYFERAFVNGRAPTHGLVGYFDGYPVFLTPGILNTYTANATGVITAQTGGTNTAVILAETGVLGLARAGREFDDLVVFDTKNDRQAALEGEVTILATTYMAAVTIIPAGANYFAFAV